MQDLPEGKFLQVVALPFREDREAELITAIWSSSLKAVRAALDIPVDPNTRQAALATPLEIAAGRGLLSIVSCLVEAGADPDGGLVITPMAAAASNGHAEIVRYLLEVGAARDLCIVPECTALQAAAEANNTLIARCLVVAGAGVGVPDTYGRCPAHYAAWAAGTEVLQYLLQARADPEVADIYGNTPLHLAAQNGRPKSVKLLLRFGADRTKTNGNGKSPLQLAHDAASTSKVWRLVSQILELPPRSKPAVAPRTVKAKVIKRPASGTKCAKAVFQVFSTSKGSTNNTSDIICRIAVSNLRGVCDTDSFQSGPFWRTAELHGELASTSSQ